MGGGPSQQQDETATSALNIQTPNNEGSSWISRSAPASTTNGPVSIPYTAYSINRPISESPITTNSATARVKMTDDDLLSNSPSSRRSPGSIITVSEGTHHTRDPSRDEDIVKISDIPFLKPLLPGSVNLPESDVLHSIEHIDPKSVLKICARYQQYIRRMADQISTNQHKLVLRVKNVNTSVTILQTQLNDRQKKYQKYVNHFQKLNDISASLDKTATTIRDVESLLDILNNVLPDSERLENLTRLN